MVWEAQQVPPERTDAVGTLSPSRRSAVRRAEQRGSDRTLTQSVPGRRVALRTLTTLHCVPPFEA